MIKKFICGNPIETDAVICDFETMPLSSDKGFGFGCVKLSKMGEEGFEWAYTMDSDAIVYGLGEANRGINKRGYIYRSWCSDDPNHTEDKQSLYGAHNFIVVDSSAACFGLFFDYPGEITFDIGYTCSDQLSVSCAEADLYVYVITGENAYEIVKQFRAIIGRSYIPPKFAFGYGQSRWGYKNEADVRRVVDEHRKHQVPLDMVYMDIDYMVDYKDFTVNEDRFPDFESFVAEMKEQNIHLVPIIDAGVKVEEGYDIYEEGVENNFFCRAEDGSDYYAVVWPGWTHLPDMLNSEARAWFGSKYERLISKGIDGFWNDMNEPALFYTKEGEARLKANIESFEKGELPAHQLGYSTYALANNMDDYKSFYHNMDGKKIRHDKVHNIYGFNMTRAAAEAFDKIVPDKRLLLFSRSSYIGMHRYGGVWTGDNKSWWSHILLNLKMLPSLNMCGFLYSGADIGGFGENATRDLLLRWLALGVFTPLMRNHAALGTREQEFYQFENSEDFRHVIGVRYHLLPYIYSEFMKAALRDDMLFKPLAFEYPKDEFARRVEDQLMLGNEAMIAPVYEQNAAGRYVYLPEEMMFIKFLPDGEVFSQTLEKGHHYVEVALTEVPLFIRKDKVIPIVDFAENVEAIDMSTMKGIGYKSAEYELYNDDGVSKV